MSNTKAFVASPGAELKVKLLTLPRHPWRDGQGGGSWSLDKPVDIVVHWHSKELGKAQTMQMRANEIHQNCMIGVGARVGFPWWSVKRFEIV